MAKPRKPKKAPPRKAVRKPAPKRAPPKPRLVRPSSPPGPAITPHLTVQGAPEAIAFYERAFGAEERGVRLTDPAGNVMHAELEIAGARFHLAEESPEFGNLSPRHLGGSAVRLALSVPNVDEVVARAIHFGAAELIPVTDQFYGDRSGRIADPFGHVWIISTHVEDVSPDELRRRLQEMFGEG